MATIDQTFARLQKSAFRSGVSSREARAELQRREGKVFKSNVGHQELAVWVEEFEL